MVKFDWVDGFLQAERLPPDYARHIRDLHAPLAATIASRVLDRNGKTLVVGICGPQGSGKSTMVQSLRRILEMRGLSAAILALDDLYLPRAEREYLRDHVHALLLTRGVPGTHDAALAIRVLSSMRCGAPASWPSFDKARDDRGPEANWHRTLGAVQVVLFEGWCVGARPQPDSALVAPVNALERDEDPDGVWRKHVNASLAGEYRALFGLIDMQVLLMAPSFEEVFDWRLTQEQKLRAQLIASGRDLSRCMDEADLRRFVSHYQRLTCHILEEMPGRADAVIGVRVLFLPRVTVSLRCRSNREPKSLNKLERASGASGVLPRRLDPA